MESSVLEEDYEYEGRKIEGFVIEDSAGYMTKLKLSYYNFWKFLRGVSHEAIRKGYITRTSALNDMGIMLHIHAFEHKGYLLLPEIRLQLLQLSNVLFVGRHQRVRRCKGTGPDGDENCGA